MISDNYKCFIVKIDTSTSFKEKFIANDIQLNRLYMRTGCHFEIQDGGRKGAVQAWHCPSKVLFITNLAMYQVSRFYQKMHDFFSHIRPTIQEICHFTSRDM